MYFDLTVIMIFHFLSNECNVRILSMNKYISNPILITILVIALSFLALPIAPWNNALVQYESRLLLKIRGERKLSDRYELVYIGPEDIKTMGGWPITRDYYGYLTHILQQSGARAVGFDVLFESPDKLYPEYDQALADFIQTSQRVCLPMAFSEIKYGQDRQWHGQDATFPFHSLKKAAKAIGFSNLGEQTVVHSLPLVVQYQDSAFYSLGFQLACLYLHSAIPPAVKENPIQYAGKLSLSLTRDNCLLLNHFGGIDKIRSMSLTRMLQMWQNSPDSLDLKDRLVLVAVTAPGLASLKMTPFSPAFPASLLHLTAAENIIERSYLRPVPLIISLAILSILGCCLYLAQKRLSMQHFVLTCAGLFALYSLTAMLVFVSGHFILPLLYPLMLVGLYAASVVISTARQHRGQQQVAHSLLHSQIEYKTAELEEAENKLSRLQEQLAQEKQISSSHQQLLQEKMESAMELEKQLQDLLAYSAPRQTKTRFHETDVVHSDTSPFIPVLELAHKVSQDTIPVLITGETGTGKEMVAQFIHNAGPRRKGPFVAVNCGALPDTLLESELFGHEKGSFTGATAQRKGRFELANGGTIFLDEVTETSQAFQAKLLRVVQEGILERVGGERPIRVDVRIIAATNKNIKEYVTDGRFREDLYYRLNGFPIFLPPLRQRSKDIPLLAHHLLKKHGFGDALSFSDHVMDLLCTYPWPGNVRELENTVRRAAILAQSDDRRLIQAMDLSSELSGQDRHSLSTGYKPVEDQILEMMRRLEFSHSAIHQTAKALGNRDRGTITEYVRGTCFEYLVKNDFDLAQTAKALAASANQETIQRVEKRVTEYLNNIKSHLGDLKNQPDKTAHPAFKGLPKKYHTSLIRIIEHLTAH
jgi:transcriptional regulator with GAF, ATPase, and Fis domain/CHASE2 domain-containing sensor protein